MRTTIVPKGFIDCAPLRETLSKLSSKVIFRADEVDDLVSLVCLEVASVVVGEREESVNDSKQVSEGKQDGYLVLVH